MYSPSSSCALKITSNSSEAVALKIRNTSSAQRLNNCQSFFGAPSNSQMIGIGYGSQMSVARSHLPFLATGSMSEFMTSRINGRRRSAARGENDGATKRRSRVCTSPSADKIDSRRRSLRRGSLTPKASAARAAALCQRLSRKMATQSSYLKIGYAKTPLAIHDSLDNARSALR